MSVLLVLVLALLGLLSAPSWSSAQSCTQTLSAGNNVASAVSSAPNGSVICLNGGNYGSVGFTNISRSGVVTLQSASGVGAQMSPQVYNSRFITFRSMTLTGMFISQCSNNVQILDSTFVPDTSHLTLRDDTPCASNQNILIDGNTFDRGQTSTWEGRLSMRGQNGITISNNTFSNVPTSNASDGIQLVGGVRNITIGPGNIFDGINQGLCGPVHCDAIQLYGAGPDIAIIGNWFKPTTSTFIMAPDGSSNVTIENNLFDARGSSYQPRVQMGTAANSIQRHNTAIGTNLGCTSKTGNPASTNCVVENNILINAEVDFSYGSGCSNCTRRYNLFQSSGDTSGSNSVIGTPVFGGGTYPTTWAGWRLSAGSPGENAGSDGSDIGVNYYGTGTGTGSASSPPLAPTDLRVQ